MGRLDNHKDLTALNASQAPFTFHKEHEELYCGLQSAAKVLLVTKPIMARSDPEVYGWVRALTESHIPFDEVKLAELTPELLHRWDVVVLGDVKQCSPQQTAMLDEYVAQGGIVLASGNAPALQCLGVESVQAKHTDCMSSVFEIGASESALFPRSAAAHYVVPGACVSEIQFAPDTKTMLHMIPEHPFGPPEMCYYTTVTDVPGLGITPHGKGKGVYIPWSVGSFYYNEGYDNTLHFLQDVLHEVCALPELAPGLHPSVELTLSKKANTLAVQLVNGSGVFANSYFKPVPMQDITLRLPGLAGKTVSAHNGGSVSCADSGDDLILTLDRLNAYEIITVQ